MKPKRRNSLPRRYLAIIIAICTWIILSVLVFFVVRNREYQSIQTEFKLAVNDQFNALQKEITADFDAVQFIHSLYQGSQQVTREEFRTYVKPIILHHSTFQAMEWVPRVLHTQRKAYEQAAQEDGYPDFQITERDAQGKMVRAGKRNEYFPVYYMEPYEGNEIALGFDLASDPGRLKALDKSRDTGEMIATSRITLVQEAADQYGFMAFLPVYRKQAPTDTVEQRRKNLLGFVSGVFQIGQMIEESLTYLQTEGIDIYFYDKSVSPDGQFLYARLGHPQNDTGQTTVQEKRGYRSRLEISYLLNMADRQWLVLFKAGPEFAAWRWTWQSWGVLVGGLLFTILLFLYLIVNLRRSIHVEQLAAKLSSEATERRQAEDELQKAKDEVEDKVKERTDELASIVELLQKEIADRRHVEEALRESEKRFKDISENAGEWIWEVDSKGRYTYSSPVVEKLFGYKPQEILEKHFYDLFHPEDREALKKAAFEVFTSKQPFHEFLNRNVHKNGKTVWLLRSGIPIFDDKGNLLGYRGADTNITDRKETEKKIEKNYQTQSVLNSLLSISLEDISLKEQLERSLDAILSVPFLPLVPKGGIMLVKDEPDVLVLEANRDLPSLLQGMCAKVPFGRCLCGRAAASRQIEFADCLDHRHENRYEDITPHGHYNVPILSKDRVLGVVVLYLREGHRPEEQEVKFLQAVADTLAGVIERKRAEEEIFKYSQELMGLAESSNVLGAVSFTENIHQTICDVVIRDFDIQLAWLGFIERENHDIKSIAQSGSDGAFLPSVKIMRDDLLYDMSPIGAVVREKSFKVINNIMDAGSEYGLWREEISKRGLRSYLALPFFSSDDSSVFAVLNIFSADPHFFTSKRIHLLQVFANYSTVAVENRLLIEGLEKKVQERTQELEEYGFKLHKLYEISFASKANAYEFANLILKEVADMLDVDAALIGNVVRDKWVAYAVSDRRGVDIREGMHLSLQELYCGIVNETKNPLLINDATVSQEYNNHPNLIRHGTKSYLGVPVFVVNEFFGVLCTFSRSPRPYTEYDLILHQLMSKRLEFEFVREKFENEIRTAMTEAEYANRAKSDFLANMSHELRTPMNTILGFSDMMLKGIGGELAEKQVEYLGIVYESGAHLLSLINDILDLSKIEAGEMDLEYTEVDVRNLIESSLVLFKQKAIKYDIKFSSDIADNIDTIEADNRKCKQVLVNLLSNAVKYTPEGGAIAVLARKIKGSELGIQDISELDKDYVEIGVSDTGPGVKKEYISKLFMPFQHFEDPYLKKHEGTGLGLALCRRILDLHGGVIWVESEEGKGSVFKFVLPCKVEPSKLEEIVFMKEASVRDQRMVDPASKFLTWEYFCTHIERTILFHKRMGYQFGLLRIKLIPGDEPVDYLLFFGTLRKVFRMHEVVANGKDRDCYCVAFLNSNRIMVDTAVARFSRAVREIGYTVDIRTVIYPEDGKNRKELFEELNINM